MSFQPNKFRGLVHYICARCPDPTQLGALKLNKALWFADTIAFAMLGQSITGVQYVKQKSGPVPKPISPAIDALIVDGSIRVDDVDYYGHAKQLYVSLREPDASVFSVEQLDIIDDVIRSITAPHAVTAVRDLMRDDIWKLAGIGEEIPLSAMLATNLGNVTEADLAWARTCLRRESKSAA